MSISGLLALQAQDGATVTLERYPILIGRSVPGGTIPDVDVSHLDPGEAVDNRHCELIRVPTGVEVHDLGGISGTWVDGRRLPPGGRALLEVGGSLRVAGVATTLVGATGALGPPSPSIRSLGATGAAAPWLETGPAQGVPPPPSAGGAVLNEDPDLNESRPVELDLSGAPVLARDSLERGAEAVRVRPGEPLQVLIGERWTQQGQPLSPAAAAEAVATARRALTLPDDAISGEGHAGDVALDFVLPPLSDRLYLAVRRAPQVPAPLDRSELDDARRVVAEGGALLVVGPWPEPALAALAERFQIGFLDARVVSYGSNPWWVPSAWPVLDPNHPGAVQAALTGGELFLNQPPDSIVGELLMTLPRAGGGTVLALRQHSLVGALERIARQVDPTQLATTSGWQREEVARLFPLALSGREGGWRTSAIGIDGQGSWTLALRPRPERR